MHDPRALGLAMGTGSHALGTARALSVGETAASFSAPGVVANALLTAAALPALCSIVASLGWLS